MMDYLPRTVEPTADDYNALVDKINELMSGGSSAASSYIPSGIGGGTVNVGPQPIWAKITGGGTGGKYTWDRVLPNGTGSTAALLFPDAVSGTLAMLPAVELSGRTDVPVDGTAIVRLEQSEVGPWFDFRYSLATLPPPPPTVNAIYAGSETGSSYSGLTGTPLIIPPGTRVGYTMTTTVQVSLSAAGTIYGYFQIRGANYTGFTQTGADFLVGNNTYAGISPTFTYPYYLGQTAGGTLTVNQTFAIAGTYTNPVGASYPVGLYPRDITSFNSGPGVISLASWSAIGFTY